MVVRVIPPDGHLRDDAALWVMTLNRDSAVLCDAAGNEVGRWSVEAAYSRFTPPNFWLSKKDCYFRDASEKTLTIDRRDVNAVVCVLEVIRHQLYPKRARRRLWLGVAAICLGAICLAGGIGMEVSGRAADQSANTNTGFTFWRGGMIFGIGCVIGGGAAVAQYRLIKRIAEQPQISPVQEVGRIKTSDF